MRNVVVVCCDGAAKPSSRQAYIETVVIAGTPVNFGLVRTDEPQFDRHAPHNRRKVLVRTKAFSCNYRDLSIILSKRMRGPGSAFYAVGSDFTGEVLETGPDVTELRPGDRVINNNHYEGHLYFTDRGEQVKAGVATNRASKEYQIMHAAKLLKIPPELPDAVAAAFGIGAQTSYSIVRRLGVQAGSNILVTSAKSNTALFVINALKKLGANVYAATTSQWCGERLRASGVKRVFCLNAEDESFGPHSEIMSAAVNLGGFQYVVDPFFDIHLSRATNLMAAGGTYITCGMLAQYQRSVAQNFTLPRIALEEVLLPILIKNLRVMGNCLGTSQDLHDAVRDYAAGSFQVLIDSEFTGHDVGAFFQQTYCSKERFGKVVFEYT